MLWNVFISPKIQFQWQVNIRQVNLKVIINVLIHDPEVDHDLFEIDDTIVLQIYFLEQLLKKTIVKSSPQQRSSYISTL